jgi:hypothetical protein
MAYGSILQKALVGSSLKWLVVTGALDVSGVKYSSNGIANVITVRSYYRFIAAMGIADIISVCCYYDLVTFMLKRTPR